MFSVGDLCLHKGYICRVTEVTRDFAGVTRPSLEYMGVKDGTEFNPTLKLMPLYRPNGQPVKNPKPRTAVSGSVEYASVAVADMKEKIKAMSAIVDLLEGKDPS
jgi:hypothetical protein